MKHTPPSAVNLASIPVERDVAAVGTAKTRRGGIVAPEPTSAWVRGEASEDSAPPPAPGDPLHPAATSSARDRERGWLWSVALACLAFWLLRCIPERSTSILKGFFLFPPFFFFFYGRDPSVLEQPINPVVHQGPDLRHPTFARTKGTSPRC